MMYKVTGEKCVDLVVCIVLSASPSLPLSFILSFAPKDTANMTAVSCSSLYTCFTRAIPLLFIQWGVEYVASDGEGCLWCNAVEICTFFIVFYEVRSVIAVDRVIAHEACAWLAACVVK